MGQYGAPAMGVAGGVIGAFWGQPGIGFMIGSIAGGLAFGSGQKKKASMADLTVTSSAYGNPITTVYGTARVAGTVFWAETIKQNNSPKKGSGKGASKSSANYFYTCSWAVALCEGPISDVIRIWGDGKLMYDKTNTEMVTHQMAKFGLVVRDYLGTEDQMPDYLIQNWVTENVIATPSACPAYRGLAYLVFDTVRLDNFADRVPSITAEVVVPPNNSYALVRAATPLPGATTGGGAWPSLGVDWLSNTAYTIAGFNIGSDITGGSITVTNLVTNTQTGVYKAADIFTPAQLAAGAASSLAWSNGIGVSQDGFIYTCSVSSDSIFWKIDANSMKCVGQVASPNFNGGNQILPMPSYDAANTAAVQAGTTPAYELIFATGAGNFGIFDSNMNIIYDTTSPTYTPFINQGNLSKIIIVPGNILMDQGSSGAEAWVLSAGFWDSTVHIYKVIASSAGATVTLAGSVTDVQLTGAAVRFGIYPDSGYYNSVDNTLIISVDGHLIKWDPSTNSIVWNTILTSSISNTSSSSYTVISNGVLGVQTGPANGFAMINLQNGSVQWSGNGQLPDGSSAGYGGWGGQSSAYNGLTNSMVSVDGGTVYNIKLDTATSAGTTLASIITNVCRRAGLYDDQFDVSAVTTAVQGFSISRLTTPKDIIEQLCGAYLVDCVETGYLLKFVPRGLPTVATIPQGDLADQSAKDGGNFWQQKRTPDMELPYFLTLRFANYDLDYQPGTAYAKRISGPVNTMWSKKHHNLEVSIVLNDTTSANMAQSLLYTAWAQRDTFTTTLGWEYLYLDPTDVVTVNLADGSTFTVRVAQIEMGSDFTLKVTFSSEDSSVYSANVQAASPTFIGQSIPVVATAQLVMMNIPLIQDSDASAAGGSTVYYAAAPVGLQGSSTTWAGGVLASSTTGSSYSLVGVVPVGAAWATTTTVLGSTSTPFSTDYKNTVTVVLGYSDAPASVSDLDMLNGANFALVGAELIQFQNVTTNSDGSVTLSTLLRGRRGTEDFVGTHARGEKVVFYSSATIMKTTVSTSTLNTPVLYDLATNGSAISAAIPVTFTPTGEDLMPYAPVNFTRAMSGSDLVVSWMRRTRLGGALLDGTGTVPLNEQSELYNVYILPSVYNANTFSISNPASYVRAFLGLTSPTLTYTAAEMTADGFNPTTGTLYVVGFQVSAVVGDGFAGAAVIPPY